MSFPLPDPMRHAFALAEAAAKEGEVPVGAVVMRGDRVVGASGNTMRASADPTAHAEMVAIRMALSTLATGRLDGCDLWVTLEPCAMCTGAIANVRLSRLYYAAPDPKGGAVAHGARFFTQPTCHHRPEIYAGIGEDRAAAQLRNFFAKRRGANILPGTQPGEETE